MAKQRTPEERERLERMLRDNPELIRSLTSRDDFRAVIIGHTYIEAVLTLILERHFPDDTKRLPGMSFELKLSLAEAFNDINPVWVPVLKKLADIRNDFAHKLGHHEVTPERRSELNNASKELKKEIEKETLEDKEDLLRDYTDPLLKIMLDRMEAEQITGVGTDTAPWLEAYSVRFTIARMFWLLLNVYDARQPS